MSSEIEVVLGGGGLDRRRARYVAGNLFAGVKRVVIRGTPSGRRPAVVFGAAAGVGAGRPAVSEATVGRLFEAYARQEVTPTDAGAPLPAIERSPWVDELRSRLLREAQVTLPARDGIVALTHDVDQIRPFSRHSMMHYLRRMPGRRHSPFESVSSWGRAWVGHGLRAVRDVVRPREPSLVAWQALERRLGVRSTYYVMESRADRRDPRNAWYSYRERLLVEGRRMRTGEFLRGLVEDEFELGPHISVQAASSVAEYRRCLEAIEAYGGSRLTTRHHWLVVDPSTTLSIMQRLGVAYDLNFGLVGFEAGTSLPYRRYDASTRQPSSVMAIPTIAMDDVLLNPNGYALTPAEARELLRGLGRAVARHGGVVAVAFHPQPLLGVDARPLYAQVVRDLQDAGLKLMSAAEAGARARALLPSLLDED